MTFTPIIAIVAIIEFFVILVMAGLIHWAGRTGGGKYEGIFIATMTHDEDRKKQYLMNSDKDRICEIPKCWRTMTYFRKMVDKNAVYMYEFSIRFLGRK